MLKAGNILESCDKVRNEVLPELGVRLEDRESKFGLMPCIQDIK